MCSIRNGTIVAALAICMTVISGCQRIVPPATHAPVNDSQMVVDEAMQVRDFTASTSYYANGDTMAGGTGYLWQTHETVSPRFRRFVEAPVATANIVALPVGVFVNNPWKSQVHTGDQIPPSHTANAPVPGRPLPTARSTAEPGATSVEEAPLQSDGNQNGGVLTPQ